MAKIGEALSSFIESIPGYKSSKNSAMEEGSIADLMAEGKQKAQETGKPSIFDRIQAKVSAFFAPKESYQLTEKKPMPASDDFETLGETVQAQDRQAAVARITEGLSTFESQTKGTERGSIAELMAAGFSDDEE